MRELIQSRKPFLTVVLVLVIPLLLEACRHGSGY